MAAWIPAVKVILPYLTQIVAAAIPAFTKKADKTGTEDITRNQIAELQDAVTHNAEALKILATQLQQVINNIDSGISKIEKEIKAIKLLAIFSMALSIVAILLWLFSWLH
jgi:septal ring factor EnvC (AmiA/AmiB activator)